MEKKKPDPQKKRQSYKSASGRRFTIVKMPYPAIGDVVCFTEEEFIWIKQNNIHGAEFDAIWELKKENFRYSPIPEKDHLQSAKYAATYGAATLEEMRKNLKKES